MDDYLGPHRPVSKRLLGEACKRIEIERGIAGPEPDAPAASPSEIPKRHP